MKPVEILERCWKTAASASTARWKFTLTMEFKDMGTKIGVIGTGNIGFGMCCNLLEAGFELVVYDVRSEPLSALDSRGANIVSSPADVGRACRLVFSVVFDHPQNLAVLQGPDGLLEKMAPGGCIFMCSTISPAHARELAGLAAAYNIQLLDCPVSGGQQGATHGALTLMIGGDRHCVDEHHTALEAISANIYYLGDVGAGAAAKIVNNLLVAVHNLAAAESLMLAAKSGIDLKQMYDIVGNSAGQSWMFDNRAMRMIERDFTPRGALKILLKDMDIALEAAQSYNLVLPLSAITREMFQAGVNQGLGDEGDSASVKVLEQMTNFSLSDQ